MVRSTRKRKWRAVEAIRGLCNEHWAIHEPSLEALMAQVAEVAGSGRGVPVEASLNPSALQITNGTALIPIKGVIVPKASSDDEYFDQVGCDAIVAAVRNAVANDSVSRILAIGDTPGGSVFGLSETAAEIMSLRGRKPMACYVEGMLASAGYFLGSAFGPIYAGPDALIGSIGSVYMHTSYQGMLEKWGLKVSPIHFGKHKVDMTPYKDLTEQGRESIQEIVDAYGEMFVQAVSRQRGIPASRVVSDYGGGKVFIASKAKEIGMIDGVLSVAQAISQLSPSSGSISATQPATWPNTTANIQVVGSQQIEAAILIPKVETLHTSEAKAPAAQGDSTGAIGGSLVTPKIKAALYAIELTDSVDANDDVCQAALRSFCRARGVEQPKDDAGILALLTSPVAKPTQNSQPMISVEQVLSTKAEIKAAAELINSGREQELVTSDMVSQAETDILEGKMSLAQAQASWKNAISNDPSRSPITVTRSAEDAFVNSAVDVLLMRCGHQPAKEPPRDMQSLSLLEMGERCAAMTGVRLTGTREEKAKQLLQINPMDTSFSAMSYNRPGDFPNLLSNLAGKILDQAIELADPTYAQWTNRLMDVPDFKPKTVLGVGAFDSLSEVMDDEDPKQLKFSEELKGFIQVGQYANKVGLTPVMMANDDLDGFNQQLMSLMQAHEFKLNSLCVALLTGNVSLVDGIALFHASHNNLISLSPGVPSAAEATKVKTMMRSQAGIGTTRTIKAYPSVVLVPYTQEDAAEQTYLTMAELLRRNGENKVATTDGTLNVHRGRTNIVVEPELDSSSTTAWYAIDPRFRTIVHAFQTGFSRGGMRTTWYDQARGTRYVKLEGRFGAAAVGYRGIVKDPGA